MFRQEVLEHKKNPHLGKVFINTPMPYRVITPVVVLLMLGCILFLLFGEYSEKFVVTGFVNASKGMIRVYPAQEGTIVKSFIHLNQSVEAGQALFIIHTTHAASEQMLNNLRQRRRALIQSITRKKKQLEQLKPLLAKKYIALDVFNAKQDDIIQLKQQQRLIELDILRHQEDIATTLRAPAAGTVSSLNYHQGQYASPSRSLLSILPKNTRLIAELCVPVQYAGFLHQKHHITIHYDAYPYEHFGSYEAVIEKISQSIITDEEDSDKPFRVGLPYYKILARLNSQSVNLAGYQKRLQQGMTFSAIITGPKKRLWRALWTSMDVYYGD